MAARDANDPDEGGIPIWRYARILVMLAIGGLAVAVWSIFWLQVAWIHYDKGNMGNAVVTVVLLVVPVVLLAIWRLARAVGLRQRLRSIRSDTTA